MYCFALSIDLNKIVFEIDKDIPAIENLGACLDQIDTLDLSNNNISRMENFPLMKRLKSIILTSNSITTISSAVPKALSNLQQLVLTNNRISFLSEIANLSGLKHLWLLSLSNNPVTKKPYYRLFIIYILPSLCVLDFCKVKRKEREEARKLFSSKAGKRLIETIKNGTGTTISEKGSESKMIKISENNELQSLSEKERVEAIKKAIMNAKTPEELEKNKAMLLAGIIPEASSISEPSAKPSIVSEAKPNAPQQRKVANMDIDED